VEAADVFRHAVSIDKLCADSRNNLGMVLSELARPAEALPHFLKAVELKPSHGRACVNLINLLMGEQKYEKAHEIIEQVYAHNCAAEDFLLACCDVYFRAKMLDRAERFARERIARFPTLAGYHLLNRCLLHQHKHGEFIDNTLEINRLYPDDPSTLVHTVTVLSDNGDTGRARALLEQELLRAPDGIESNIANAYTLLRQFDLASGWEAYEHRLRLEPGHIHFNQKPNWDGASLRGRRVLVLAEQGVGDVIFYARFLDQLVAEAEKVYLLCDPRLRSILEANFPRICFIADPLLLPVLGHQVSIALASLAKVYAGHADCLHAARGAYIHVNQNLKDCWDQHLRGRIPEGMPRIGFSLNAGIDEYNRLKRSCPFSSFLALWPARQMAMIDLDHYREDTYKSRRVEAQAGGMELIAFDGVTNHLDHLCALISQLDLVITTQQTNAHLCGALGVACIVMLPQGPHFVYGNDGNTTPWYPSLHLLRLGGWHQWDGLSDAVARQVRHLLPDFFG
jgi:tetratricopeptide (TPR) repeat protein